VSRARAVVGSLAILVGLVWIGQGLGVVPGSFMTGQAFWAAAGIVTALVGVWLLRSAGPGVR
jgi:hypothetical protein